MAKVLKCPECGAGSDQIRIHALALLPNTVSLYPPKLIPTEDDPSVQYYVIECLACETMHDGTYGEPWEQTLRTKWQDWLIDPE